ncbi:MFS transporter [Paenibacillus sp. GCM10012303]|uniref:MFS transporter n=1 Tax=Paenibacillus sp. GCM10012303 TaxID=3317340 RepID=UPI0036121B39
MTTLFSASAPRESAADHQVDPKRWYALAVMLLSVLLISFNTYMVQVALPLIQDSLHAAFSEAQLIVTGFSLGLAIALIVSGKLGDLYGRKRMLAIGVSGFTILAAIGGIATDPAVMIPVRIMQGLAAALIQPQVLSTLQVCFSLKEKALAFGIYGAMIGIGFTFGLILGGMIVDWNVCGLGWRAIFFIHVPFGLLILSLLPIVPETRGARGQRMDWAGEFMLGAGLFLLVYPLSEGQKQGWPLWTLGCLLAAALILFIFTVVQIRKRKRGTSPLIDLNIFKHRTFRVGILTAAMIYLGMFSLFFILTYYLQFGLRYDVQATSLVFLPLGAGFFIASLVSSRLVGRWGTKVLRLGAIAMGSGSLLLMGSLRIDPVHLLHIRNMGILTIYGFGLGLAATPLVNVVLGAVPARDAGTGSGLFNTWMYLANSIGVALIGLLFSAVLGNSSGGAELPDYVRAFTSALAVTGGLGFLAYVCLCFLPDRP